MGLIRPFMTSPTLSICPMQTLKFGVDADRECEPSLLESGTSMLAASAVTSFNILDEACNGLIALERELRYGYINSPAPISTRDSFRKDRVLPVSESSK